jgi:NTP pyrophosphatase (non-canonical NTP hydrolase)
MQIELPEVDWQNKGWTIPGQIKKVLEEAGEVAEAIAENDAVNIIKEALDTAQTCFTLIDMVIVQNGGDKYFAWESLLAQHEAKLRAKGYLKPEISTLNSIY